MPYMDGMGSIRRKVWGNDSIVSLDFLEHAKRATASSKQVFCPSNGFGERKSQRESDVCSLRPHIYDV